MYVTVSNPVKRKVKKTTTRNKESEAKLKNITSMTQKSN